MYCIFRHCAVWRLNRARELHLLFCYYSKYHQNKEAYDMEHRRFGSIRANKRVLIATITVLLVATLVALVPGLTGHGVRRASARNQDPPRGPGQLPGPLPPAPPTA